VVEASLRMMDRFNPFRDLCKMSDIFREIGQRRFLVNDWRGLGLGEGAWPNARAGLRAARGRSGGL
jgi:hypothetical protein